MEAIEYCSGLNELNFGGYSEGWRLPDGGEFFNFEWAEKNGGVFTHNSPNQDYWSFRTDGSGVVHKGNADGLGRPVSVFSDRHIRCARSLESARCETP